MKRKVSDVMTRTVVSVSAFAPFKDIVRRMQEYRVSAVPVVDEDHLVLGLVSEGDLILKEDPTSRESLVCSMACNVATTGRRRRAGWPWSS